MAEAISWVLFWGSICAIAWGPSMLIDFHNRGMTRVRSMK